MYYTQLYPSARDSSKMTDCTVEESKDYIQYNYARIMT